MTADNSSDVRQTHTRSLELVRTMEALENAEQFSCVLHVEPGAIVANVDDGLTARGLAVMAYLDRSRRAPSRVLDGIRQQVDRRLKQKRSITDDGWKRPYEPINLPVARFDHHCASRFGYEIAQVEPLHIERRARQAGELEEIVHQPVMRCAASSMRAAYLRCASTELPACARR